MGVCCIVLLSRLVIIFLIIDILVLISGSGFGILICRFILCVWVVNLNFCVMLEISFFIVKCLCCGLMFLCFSCVSLNSCCERWCILLFWCRVMVRYCLCFLVVSYLFFRVSVFRYFSSEVSGVCKL